MKNTVIILLAVLLLLGAGYAGYKMLSLAKEYRDGEQVYLEMQQISAAKQPQIEAEEQPHEAQPETAEKELRFPHIDFAALEEVNEETVGWIYIEGTNINYPVVQGEDNRRYVSTMFDGSENKAGSIFMDYRNDPSPGDLHTVLYGHNMKNKTMFADIRNYGEQSYYDEHPVGMYITPDANYRIDFAAGYVASLADPAWQIEFVTEDDAYAWLQEAMSRSDFVSGAEPQRGGQMITLSTCSYEFDEARYVLVGILRPCGVR